MATQERQFAVIDRARLEGLRKAEKPILGIRLWVAVVAILLCIAQSYTEMYLLFETGVRSGTRSLMLGQFSLAAVMVLLALVILVNPVLRSTRVARPLNRAELIAIFAALFVSGTLNSTGLIANVFPLMARPRDPDMNTKQQEWDRNLEPYMNRKLFINNPEVIKLYQKGLPDLPQKEKGFSAHVRHTVKRAPEIIKAIPWKTWLLPFLRWMVLIGSVYVIFYSLSVLIFESWAKRERLPYPLAQIPEMMLPEEDHSSSAPSLLKNRGFLAAFVLIFLLYGYNGAVLSNWFSDVLPISFGVSTNDLSKLVENTIFRGIGGVSGNPMNGYWGFTITLNFTVLCIAFLLPQGISQSLWVYYLFGMGLVLAAIWLGFGPSTSVFGTDSSFGSNFVTSLGGGAFLAFGVVSILKIFYDLHTAARMEIDLENTQATLKSAIKTLGPHGLLCIGAAALAVRWLCWSGMSVWWAIGLVAVTVTTTAAIISLVAETGIYRVTLNVGPLHLLKSTGLLKDIGAKNAVPMAMANANLYWYTLYTPSPAIMNCFQMQELTRAPKRRFRLILIAAVLATVIAGAVFYLYYAYNGGAANADAVRIGTSGNYMVDAQRLAKAPNMKALLKLNANWVFYLLGGAWLVFSLLMRRKFFWWLHPIGLVALASPTMSELWFAIFLGWICKKVAVKFGGRYMFAQLRPVFMGLMIGELCAVFLWMWFGVGVLFDAPSAR